MKMRKAIYPLLISFSIFSFSETMADYKKFSFGPKVGYKHIIDKENNKVKIKGQKFTYGVQIYYSVTKKNSVGLNFEFWDTPIYSDGIGSEPESGDRLKVYKYSAVYKTSIGLNDRRYASFSIGASFDYYYSKIVRYATITGEETYDQVRYKDVGMTLLAEVRYRFMNLWSEISAVKLTGGKIIRDSFKWDYLGGVPNINLHNVTGGVSIMANF